MGRLSTTECTYLPTYLDFTGTRRLVTRGATWSGQVISSPPGPSGGPFIPHPPAWWRSPPGSRGWEPCSSPASPFRHSPVSASFSSRSCGRLPTASPP